MLAVMGWVVFAIFSNADSTDERKPALEVTARSAPAPTAPPPSGLCPTRVESAYLDELHVYLASIEDGVQGLAALFVLVEQQPSIINSDEFAASFVLHAAAISVSGDAILKRSAPNTRRMRPVSQLAQSMARRMITAMEDLARALDTPNIGQVREAEQSLGWAGEDLKVLYRAIEQFCR